MEPEQRIRTQLEAPSELKQRFSKPEQRIRARWAAPTELEQRFRAHQAAPSELEQRIRAHRRRRSGPSSEFERFARQKDVFELQKKPKACKASKRPRGNLDIDI